MNDDFARSFRLVKLANLELAAEQAQTELDNYRAILRELGEVE